MKQLVHILSLTLFLTVNLVGQIYCPSDIMASCFSSLTIEECGNATVVSGNYHPSQVKFEDDSQLNACNEGQVFRKFYIDVDYSNSYTDGEPSCTQTITLTYDNLPLNIQYPSELILSCFDEVPNQSPTWSSHPCDLIGYTYDDEIFEFESGACLKIVRTFSVINWCEYEVGNGEGLYTGVQIIKVVDDIAPEIDNCDDIVFDAVENCEATITLTNTANDSGDCPSGLLQWTLSVDLWADGTEDLFYGPNEPQPFKIDKIQNGEELSITLPENVGISNHKLVWKVTDGCGNVRSCSSNFEVKDNKPPTPYCKNFLSATLNGENGGSLVIPVELFDNGAIDNCSSQEELQMSFSENVDDKTRTIECGEIGFQFYRIYYTDASGNQDFCEVFMFVLDNGSCSGKFEPQGRVVTRSGVSIEDAEAYLMNDEGMISESNTAADGSFSFGDQSMMEDYYTTVTKYSDPMEGVDILDYQMMVNGALGINNLDYYKKIAADINEDGQFDLDDLRDFRNILIGESEMTPDESWKFIPMSQVTNSADAVYDNKMSIMDYQNGFNFWAVKKGDLSGTEYSNTPLTVEQIELDLVITDDEVTITNSESIKTGFFYLELNVDNDLVINKSTKGDLHGNNDISKVINLENESVSFDSNELNIAINYKSNETVADIKKALLGKLSFMNESHTGLSTVNWTVVDKRERGIINKTSVNDNLNVFPTVFSNQITIQGRSITSVNITTINGQTVTFSSEVKVDSAILNIDASAPSGIYFLSVSTENGDRVFKVIK